jgi:ADP-ribose pyrophosphatase YjhB (NUDIX family)
MPDVRPIAVAVLRHPRTGQLLVDEITEPDTGQAFHRLPGGGIEFGEPGRRTVERELSEQYGLTVEGLSQLGALESQYSDAGELRHEIALVFAAEFRDPASVQFERIPSRSADEVVAVWRSSTEASLPLRPTT